MCGIAGLISKEILEKNQLDLGKKFISTLRHRGPDSSGTWNDPGKKCLLIHTRLSIQDLSVNGSQPMRSNSGRYTIVYNGEIYNFKKLREKLNNEFSIKWNSSSDTEVFLNLIEYYGIDEALNLCFGMFAFAIFDQAKDELCIGRDRFGEKPIFYTTHENTFYFFSEIKVLENLQIPKIKNRVALSHFFRVGFIPSPHSIYENIFKLAPGHYIKINKDLKININKFINKENKQLSITQVNYNKNFIYADNLDLILKEVISEQLVADTEVGTFLSGGIDSSIITAIASKIHKKKLKTFTFGNFDNNYDESQYAKKISEYLGTDHHEIFLDNKDILSVVQKMSLVYDEPFADSSQIPTYLVSKLASKYVKVVLTGDGGDEVFYGYNRYIFANKYLSYVNNVPRSIRRVLSNILNYFPKNLFDRLSGNVNLGYSNFGQKIEKISRALKGKNSTEIYANILSQNDVKNILKWNINTDIEQSDIFKLFNSKLSNLEKFVLTDRLSYLPDDILTKVDRASMFNSLETRAPFIDYRVVSFADSLPKKTKIDGSKTKIILRDLIKKYYPDKLFNRPKMGFGVPIHSWFRGALKDWTFNIIKESDDSIIDKHIALKLLEEHISKKKDHAFILWNVVMFLNWQKKNEN